MSNLLNFPEKKITQVDTESFAFKTHHIAEPTNFASLSQYIQGVRENIQTVNYNLTANGYEWDENLIPTKLLNTLCYLIDNSQLRFIPWLNYSNRKATIMYSNYELTVSILLKEEGLPALNIAINVFDNMLLKLYCATRYSDCDTPAPATDFFNINDRDIGGTYSWLARMNKHDNWHDNTAITSVYVYEDVDGGAYIFSIRFDE